MIAGSVLIGANFVEINATGVSIGVLAFLVTGALVGRYAPQRWWFAAFSAWLPVLGAALVALNGEVLGGLGVVAVSVLPALVGGAVGSLTRGQLA
jgi:hypothetical protein